MKKILLIIIIVFLISCCFGIQGAFLKKPSEEMTNIGLGDIFFDLEMKAKDINDGKSDWKTQSVSTTKSRETKTMSLFLLLTQKHPNLLPIQLLFIQRLGDFV